MVFHFFPFFSSNLTFKEALQHLLFNIQCKIYMQMGCKHEQAIASSSSFLSSVLIALYPLSLFLYTFRYHCPRCKGVSSLQLWCRAWLVDQAQVYHPRLCLFLFEWCLVAYLYFFHLETWCLGSIVILICKGLTTVHQESWLETKGSPSQGQQSTFFLEQL